MEPSHSGIAPQDKSFAGSSSEPLGRGPAADRRWPPLRPLRRIPPDSFQAGLDEQTRLQLRLQRRGPENLRRHMLRSARRFAVLVIADVGSFVAMRAVLRMVRDNAVLGAWLADSMRAVLPRGLLSGSQYAVALLVSLLIAGNYGRGQARRDPRRLFVACVLATALPLWMRLWTNGVGSVVVEYVLTTLMVCAGLIAERLTLDRALSWVYPPERDMARTLFVGRAEQCVKAEASPVFGQAAGHRSVGYVDTDSPPVPGARGHVAEFARLLHDLNAESVVVCGHLPDAEFDRVVDAALTSGCQLLTSPRQIQVPGVQPIVVPRNGSYVVELSAPSLKGRQLLIKRCFDLTASLVGLVLISPVLGAIAIAIRLDSRGPVFFQQERIGRGGRRFGVWKFRTMTHGASDAVHRELVTRMIAGDDTNTARTLADGAKVYKLVKDERVTRVGAWLRRFSLDELPQVINVLMGDMSLVGPRPPLSYEVEKYDYWQYGRLQVRPGITGLWQVSGRNLLTYRQMCELDMEYVRQWSLALDLKILLKTIPVVLLNSGRAA